jgi:hypothetical protein
MEADSRLFHDGIVLDDQFDEHSTEL